MIRLLIKNNSGTYDITKLVNKIDWSGDYLQVARTLSFGLISSSTDKHIPIVKCDLGDAATLSQGNKTLFEGYIFSRSKSTNSSTIDITCFDRGIYLKRNKASYKFTNQTPEAIAQRVCSDFGIPVGSLVKTGKKLSRNFLGSCLYDIIQTAYTIASAETGKKYHQVFKGSQLYVIEKTVTDETLVIEGGSNLMDASTTDSIENMINQIAIYDKNDKLIRTVKNNEYIKLYGLMQEYIKQAEDENAGPKAQKMLDDNGIQQKITINNLGNVANLTGGTVVVREPYTGLYGLFYIDSDAHTWKNGQYFNKLTVNFKNIMDEKEVGVLPNKTGSQTGGTWAYTNKPGS